MSTAFKFSIEINNKIASLEHKIESLTSIISGLTAENLALKTENTSLKERLGLNSKNSSIPSSKELYKIKNDNPRKSLKKQGAQIGHKGHLRDSVTTDEIIKIELNSNQCECGGAIDILEKY